MLLLLAVSACALRAPPRRGISMSAGTPIRRRQLGTSDLVVSDVCLGTMTWGLSLIHISEPTRLGMISYAVFCLKKKR